MSRLRASVLLVASLSACAPPAGQSPSSVPPPRPSFSYDRGTCNGPWLTADDHPALPEDDAARRRLWESLAPESLPPPHSECNAGAPPRDIPERDFGLAPYSQPTPFEPLTPPQGWAAERPELAPLLLPAIQSSEQSWHRGEGTYEHAFTTTHWVGAILPETLASFDRAARAAGLRLGSVERSALAFSLRYASTGARLHLHRASRTQLWLELTVTIPGELSADPAVAAALGERPVASRVAERMELRGARRRGAHWHATRWDFSFVRDPRRKSEDELARASLVPARCPYRGWKGTDPRRCYFTSDGRALVVVDGPYLDVLDEAHDHDE